VYRIGTAVRLPYCRLDTAPLGRYRYVTSAVVGFVCVVD